VSPASAGLGLGVIIVVLVSIFSAGKQRGTISPLVRPAIYTCLRWTPWLALLVFMAKSGACQDARYLAPYYPLLLLALLSWPGMAALARCRWWQRLVVSIMAATLAFMLFEYGRAFVPSSVFARLHDSPHLGFLRVLDDYNQARLSVAAYQDFTTRHSAGETVVGYSTLCGGLEPGMWQPWGHGHVERILPDDSPEWVRSQGIRSIFIEDAALKAKHETIGQWLEQFNATIVDQMTFSTDPGSPRTHLYFTRLAFPGEPATTPPATRLPD